MSRAFRLDIRGLTAEMDRELRRYIQSVSGVSYTAVKVADNVARRARDEIVGLLAAILARIGSSNG